MKNTKIRMVIRVCLDTSVISTLFATHAIERIFITRHFIDRLKEGIKTGRYTVYLSNVAFREMLKCKEPKRQKMFDVLEEVEHIQIPINREINNIVKEILRLGVLKKKHLNDCRHIGSAVYKECDYLVS
jgi:hypothetical protein